MLVRIVCHMSDVVSPAHEARIAARMKELDLAQNVAMSADRLQVVGDFTHVPSLCLGEELSRLKSDVAACGVDFISVRY